MLRKFLALCAALLLSGTAFAAEKAAGEHVSVSGSQLECTKGSDGQLLCKPLDSSTIVLTTQNLVVLRGPIDGQSASTFVSEFQALENRDETDTIYVYVRSPGGSIFAGDTIANIVSSSKKKVVMLVDFAASMAFDVVMHGQERVAQPTATLMQHWASGGTGDGQFPNVDKQWDWIKRKVGSMQDYESARCTNTTKEQFLKNIDRDWWMLSDEALKAGCIDKVAKSVTCSKDLTSSTRKETFNVFGFRVQLEWSGCPLELYPKSVSIANISGFPARLNDVEVSKIDEFLLLISDPLKYYQRYGSFEVIPAAPIKSLEVPNAR